MAGGRQEAIGSAIIGTPLVTSRERAIDTATITAAILAAIISALGASIAGAGWVARQWVTHRLDRELEVQKATLQEQLRKEVEEYLGDKAADREYNLEARKRLYQAIGPLRFQLLVACRDAATRIRGHGTREQYSMDMRGYYGRSTLYRLLRPISISELIERQMSYADFSVDPTAVELLRFKRAVFSALTGGAVALNHPNLDWTDQIEHVVYDYLSRAANALIVNDNGTERVMQFSEFDSFVEDRSHLERLSPLPEILGDFRISRKPIFWLRLVCFGYICIQFVRSAGHGIGFQQQPYELSDMLSASENDFILQNLKQYEEQIASIAEAGL